MNQNTDLLLITGPREGISYRLVYLQPNSYSDEKIVVGLIGQSTDLIESKFVTSSAAIGILVHLIGEDGVEQYHFAADEVRRKISQWREIAELSALPSSLLTLGETMQAITSARDSLYKEILEVSSSLYRSCSVTSLNRDITGQSTLTKTLHERVSRLNPLIADNLFSKRKIQTDAGDIVEVPIYGNKIFGAPVSFGVREFGEPRMRAEAYVAKFNWLKKYVTQEPRVYVLAPTQKNQVGTNRLEASIRELLAIANAASVPLRQGETPDDLAAQVISDEAA